MSVIEPKNKRNLDHLQLCFFVFSPGEKDSMIFDCTERYDPVTKQWAAVASLNYPRCGVGVCPCHGALYALGECPHVSPEYIQHKL